MSAYSLKILAVVTMLIDHLGAMLYHISEYREIASFMRVIGRMAFPIYVFFIAEGMRRTKSRENYLLRLFIFALVSYMPFSLAAGVFSYGFNVAPVYLDWNKTNVFFTLLIGAAAIYIYDISKKYLSDIPGVIGGLVFGSALCLLAGVINTDYGTGGSAAIFLTYLFMEVKDERFTRFLRVFPLIGWVFYIYHTNERYLVMALTVPLLIILYDGSHGPKWTKNWKMAFYMFYPVHLILIYLLSIKLRGI